MSSETLYTSSVHSFASANISRIYGATGYNSTCITACAASTQAIGEAAEIIKNKAAGKIQPLRDKILKSQDIGELDDKEAQRLLKDLDRYCQEAQQLDHDDPIVEPT